MKLLRPFVTISFTKDEIIFTALNRSETESAKRHVKPRYLRQNEKHEKNYCKASDKKQNFPNITCRRASQSILIIINSV